MADVTKELLEQVKQMREDNKAMKDAIDKAGKTAVRGSGVVDKRLGNYEFGQNWSSDPRTWPWDKMRDLDGAYASSVALEMMQGRRKSLSGVGDRRFGTGRGTFGQALVKMAGLAAMGSDNRQAYDIAHSQGLASDYNSDKFEEEFGITTVTKAAKVGCRGFNGEIRKTSLAENAGQTGGFILPPQFMTELLTVSAEEGFIQQLCKVIPMTTREVEWPILDITTVQAIGTAPYFGGTLFQWQPEAQLINQTQPAFRQSKWTAWDLVGTTACTNQLLMDNGIGLDALLTQLFGEAITWYSEYAFLDGLGAGASMPLGILNSPATIQQTRSVPGHFTLRDAAAMLSHLQIRSWDTCCWVVHQSVIPDLIQMVDNTAHSQLVWLSPYGNGASNMGPLTMKLPQAFLNGRPLYITEKLPTLGNTGDVLLADFSRYVVGNRMDIQIDVSPHYLFANNQLMWRVIARKDGKPWQNAPLTDAQGWTLSPFIALK